MVVVAEPVTNSLIVSATSRFYNEVLKLIEQLDQRPPMVMIDVLMAQITLTEDDEFGVQLGLQDSVLFNRSSAITSTTSGAGLAPGFAFNDQPLGNTINPNGNPGLVGTQGLSDLGMGRTNSNLGFGGLVLSASSESVSVLLRALKQQGRVDILSRPTIMTLHNQPAYVQVGQVVPVVTTVSQTTAGTTSGTTSKNTGLVMQVIPRISPDGLVVMDIDVSTLQPGAHLAGNPDLRVEHRTGRQLADLRPDAGTNDRQCLEWPDGCPRRGCCKRTKPPPPIAFLCWATFPCWDAFSDTTRPRCRRPSC